MAYEFDGPKLKQAENPNGVRFGGSGGKYMGDYQMSRTAWKEGGGNVNDWDNAYKGGAMPSSAEQNRVAKNYWDKNCTKDGYAAWNQGAGGANKLHNSPKTLNELGMCKSVKGQAPTKNADCDTMTGAEAYDKLNGYYDGKTPGDTGSPLPPFADEGQPTLFGGIIQLWLVENAMNVPWTTEENNTVNMWFKVDPLIGYYYTDTFKNNWNGFGVLDFDYDIGLPFVDTQIPWFTSPMNGTPVAMVNNRSYFIPISRG